MVVAPEHRLLPRLTAPEQKDEVEAYVKAATTKSDLERTELQKSKTGVFTGERQMLFKFKFLICASLNKISKSSTNIKLQMQ